MSNCISGIYLIKNKLNGKVYVGSSIDMENRWRYHRSDLNNNRHHNAHLQNAWDKYGENVFEFSVLEHVNEESSLLEREQYWMDKLECYNSDKGYNINPTAGSQLGMVLSEELKIRIAKGSKIRKPVLQIDMKGNIVNEFISINTAAKRTDISRTSLKKSISDRIFFREFAWVHKDEYLSNKDIILEYFDKDKTGCNIPKRGESYTKGVVKIDSRGKKTLFNSASQASEQEGIGAHMIKKYCETGKKDLNNNMWIYEEEYFLRKVN